MKSMRLMQRHPSAVLMLVQLLGMLVYPFLESTASGKTIFNVIGVIVLVTATRMVRRTPGHVWISASIAVPVIALLLLQVFFDMPYLLPIQSVLEAMFYFYAASSLISYMMEDRETTTDELFAAGATFTLLAWGFTHLFVMIEATAPGSFAAAVNVSSPRTWTELNYLSFALLSSTGIGDVIPLTSYARAVASVEMLVGIMYLTAVVTRLIGFTLQHSERK